MSAVTVSIAVLVVLVVASWYLATGFWNRILTGLAKRQAGLKAHDITVDGVRWHYLQGGKGPILLLVHGFGADTTCWLPLARSFGQRFSLLIPDLPGFGKSEPPRELPFDIESQTRRLMAFLDALGVEECFVAGNSMGGYLATSLAASDPSRVRRLWLLAPLGVNSVPPGKALEAIDSGETVAGDVNSVSQFREDIIKPLFVRRVWLPYPLLRTQAQEAIKRKDQIPRMLAEVRFNSLPLEVIAENTSQPVLLQWGDHDLIVNPAGLPVLDEKFPNCEAHLVENCGHLPMFELPAQSARLFTGWLEKRQSGGKS